MKILLTTLAVFLPQIVSAASFFGLPSLTYPSDLSDSGAVAGYTDREAFRWAPTVGYTPLGFVDSPGYGGNHTTDVGGISSNGSLIVGASITYSTSGFPQRSQAFIWTSANGIQPLGDTSLRESSATGVSANGQVATGWVMPASFSQCAVVWTAGIETQRFPVGTAGGAVSPNGLWIGGTDGRTPGVDAFLWSAATGFEIIGSLGSGTDSVHAVSDDGSIAIGQGGNYTPFRWTRAGGILSLGLLEAGDFGYATDMTADGSIVVGAFGSAGAFIWTAQSGLRYLQEVLTNDRALNLSGWSLRGATSISSDGSTIVGYGIHNGVYEGFVASVPEPSLSVLLLAGAGLLVSRRRLRPNSSSRLRRG